MSKVRFLGISSSRDLELEVAYWAQFPRDAEGLCALCHGDPCNEEKKEGTPLAKFYKENKWAQTCPVCDGRPS